MIEPRVVILTPRYDEPHDDGALMARSLAHAYATSGVRATVVCPAVLPRPSVEVRGGLEIRRYSVPRCHAPSFVPRAVAAAWEIERKSRCVAIECIESPSLVVACKFAALAGLLSAPIVHVRVRKADSEFDTCADAIADGVEVFERTFTAREDAAVLSPAASAGLWTAPEIRGPVLVVPNGSASGRFEALESLFASGGQLWQGWSLAGVGPDGRWRLRPADHTASIEHDRVLIVDAGSEEGPLTWPAVACEAIGSGELPLIGAGSPLVPLIPPDLRAILTFANDAEFVQRLRTIVTASFHQRRAWADSLRAAWPLSNDELMREKRHRWSSVRSCVPPAAVAAAWRLAEGAPGPLLEISG